MAKHKEIKLECFKKLYTQPAWHRGALMCHGGFGQPMCQHLKKCIEQFEEVGVPEKELKRMIRKYVTNNKN